MNFYNFEKKLFSKTIDFTSGVAISAIEKQRQIAWWRINLSFILQNSRAQSTKGHLDKRKEQLQDNKKQCPPLSPEHRKLPFQKSLL